MICSLDEQLIFGKIARKTIPSHDEKKIEKDFLSVFFLTVQKHSKPMITAQRMMPPEKIGYGVVRVFWCSLDTFDTNV